MPQYPAPQYLYPQAAVFPAPRPEPPHQRLANSQIAQLQQVSQQLQEA